MSFTDIFGGQTVSPAQLSYLPLTISADADLLWPLEQSIPGANVVADIIDINAGNPGLNVDMPDATLVSNGTNVLFNNVGAETVTVRDSTGATIISLASGTTWMIYLTDNTTVGGTWRTFQFGASVSVSNASALAGAGLKAIATTLNTRIAVSPKSSNYSIVIADRATAIVWTSGVGTFDLPSAVTVGADWYVIVRNSGSGDLTVTPPAGTIDGAATATFPPGSSAFVVCDGTNYFTIGFGSGSGGGGSGFGFITINVAGNGDYTLSGAELGQIGYRFTGALTGTRNIIVPGTTDEYWVDNQTSGAFSLFVKTVAQVPGVEILQNNRNILYCDGTNVVAAESATVSFPIPVAQGGTGAVNAAAARTNLGATVTGAALFTAVDAAAARTTIAAVPTSRNLTANNGLAGGGDLSADRTFGLQYPLSMVIKPSDTSRTLTTTRTADPHLTTVVDVGTYEIELVLMAMAESAGPDISHSLSFSGTFTRGGVASVVGACDGGSGPIIFLSFAGSSPATFVIASSSTGYSSFAAKLILDVTVSGTLSYLWAPTSSSAVPVTVYKGSFFKIRKII